MVDPVVRARVEQAIRDAVRRKNGPVVVRSNTKFILNLNLWHVPLEAALNEMCAAGLLSQGADVYCYDADLVWSGPVEQVEVHRFNRCRECRRPNPKTNIVAPFWETTPAFVAQLAPPPGTVTVGEVLDVLSKLPRADDARSVQALRDLFSGPPPAAVAAVDAGVVSEALVIAQKYTAVEATEDEHATVTEAIAVWERLTKAPGA